MSVFDVQKLVSFGLTRLGNHSGSDHGSDCGGCFFREYAKRTGRASVCGKVPCSVSKWTPVPGRIVEEMDEMIEAFEVAEGFHS